MKRLSHKLLGLILLVLSACGGAGASSTTAAWVSVASSGAVIAGTDFITSQGNTMATGASTEGVSGTFDISFSDSETGWFVGNLGEVLKTTDGGGTAELLGIGTSSALRGVFALDIPVQTHAQKSPEAGALRIKRREVIFLQCLHKEPLSEITGFFGFPFPPEPDVCVDRTPVDRHQALKGGATGRGTRVARVADDRPSGLGEGAIPPPHVGACVCHRPPVLPLHYAPERTDSPRRSGAASLRRIPKRIGPDRN